MKNETLCAKIIYQRIITVDHGASQNHVWIPALLFVKTIIISLSFNFLICKMGTGLFWRLNKVTNVDRLAPWLAYGRHPILLLKAITLVWVAHFLSRSLNAIPLVRNFFWGKGTLNTLRAEISLSVSTPPQCLEHCLALRRGLVAVADRPAEFLERTPNDVLS